MKIRQAVVTLACALTALAASAAMAKDQIVKPLPDDAPDTSPVSSVEALEIPKDIFLQIDTDHDGKLSDEELRQAREQGIWTP